MTGAEEPPDALVLSMTALGYALLMGCLAVGLWLHRRLPPGAAHRAPARRGWPALLRHLAATALGGWAVLGVVLVGYYYGMAGLGGAFLASGFAGSAALLALALPLFLGASWLTARHARHDGHGRRGRRARRGPHGSHGRRGGR